jgi:hypothetical protein
MEALIAVALIFVLGAPLGILAAYSVVKGPEVIGAIFGFRPGPSWPHGVQEDDPPPRWRLDRPSR